MSHENVELVRSANALVNAGDWEAVFALYAHDVEFRDLQPAPDVPEVVRGLDALRHVVANWTEVYDEFAPHVYEYIDADPWVICDTRWHGKVKGSDLAIDFRGADAIELKDGKVLRLTIGYPDVATALRAVQSLEG